MSAAEDMKAHVLARVDHESLYGVPQGKRIRCPIHSGTNKNFHHLKGGRFKCHSCGESGDAITFVHLRDGGTGNPSGDAFWKALAVLGKRVGIDVEEPRRTTAPERLSHLKAVSDTAPKSDDEPPAPTEAELAAFHGALVPLADDTAATKWSRVDRGLDVERVDSVGACGVWTEVADEHAGEWSRYGKGNKRKFWRANGNRIVAPVYTADGRIASFKFRSDGSVALHGAWAKKSKEVAAKGLPVRDCVMANAIGVEMLRTGQLPEGCNLVVRVEGLPDLLAAAAYGPMAAVFGSVSSASVGIGLVSRIPRGAQVILAFDADRGGDMHRKHALRAYAARSNALELFSWCSAVKGVNDVNDHVKAGGCEVSAVKGEAKITWADKKRIEEQTIRAALFEDGRPKVKVGTDHHRMTEEVAAIVSTARDVFVGPTNELAVLRDESGTRKIHVMAKEELDFRVSKTARFIKPETDKAGNVIGGEEVPPPQRIVGQVLKRGEYSNGRPLVAVLRAGTLRPDGTVASSPGYDAATRSYLDLGSAIAVPDKPTAKEVRDALNTVREPFADFPFAAPAHLSAALAIPLTIASRLAFDGPAPGALLSASTQGSGKTLIGSVAIHMGTGSSPAVSPYKKKGDEMDKVVLSTLIAGKPDFFIDNVTSTLASDALAVCLTSQVYEGRLLGTNEMLTLPVKTTFVFSANNAQLGDDMLWRLFEVRLDPMVERPEDRTGFKIPDLRAFVAQHRRRLNGALLTLLRAYAVAGRPDQNLAPWGSYEEWSALVRGCLVWLGLPDPIETRAALLEGHDGAEAELELLEGLQELQRGRGGSFVVGDVLEEVRNRDTMFRKLRSAVEDLHRDGPDNITRQALGKLFKARRHRVRSGLRITSSMGRGKRQWWEIETTAATPTINTTTSKLSDSGCLESSGGSGGSGGMGSETLLLLPPLPPKKRIVLIEKS